MFYKTSGEMRRKSLERYYKNRIRILKYQKERLKEKYKNDLEFRKKRILRDASRHRKGCFKNLNGLSCSICDSKQDLERHHPDYYNINHIIVCKKCHNKIHHEI